MAVTHVDNSKEATSSNIKIRLLSGTYTLQASKQTFGKVISDICSLWDRDNPCNGTNTKYGIITLILPLILPKNVNAICI